MRESSLFKQRLGIDDLTWKVWTHELQHLNKLYLIDALDATILETAKYTPTKITVPETVHHICFVACFFPSSRHGGGIRLLEFIRYLAKKGYELSLFCPFIDHLDRHDLDEVLTLVKNVRFITSNAFDNKDVRRYALNELTQFLDSIASPDVIHLEWPQSSIFAQFCRTRCNNLIYTNMESLTRNGLERAKNCYPWEIPSMMEFLVNGFSSEALAARYCDHVVSVCEEDAALLEHVFKRPMDVVPAPVSEDYFQTHCVEKIYDAVMFAYWQQGPNIEGLHWYMRYVHPTILKQCPDYKLLLMGASDLGAARSYHNAKDVTFIGEVETPAYYIQQAKIGLVPVVSGAGLRTKLIQYAASALPSVATELGAQGTNVPVGSAVWAAKNEQEFATLVIQLLENTSLQKTSGQKALTWATSLKVDNVGSVLEKLYE